MHGVQSDISGIEDFQDKDLLLPCPTCTDQFRTAVVLNPEAEPFTSVKERDGEKQKQENEGTAGALPI